MTGFTPEVRDAIRAGVQSSAAVIVPMLLQPWTGVRGDPVHVLDVGCGEGWFAREFARLGCVALGVDHFDTLHWADLGRPGSGPARFAPADLAREGSVQPGRWDLTVCLEVAEHLPPERAPSFIAELCATAPVIAFSAAIPGQGGTNHVNEQWSSYWAGLFAQHDYRCTSGIRSGIWDNARVEPWYRQNLMLVVDESRDRSDYEMWRCGEPLDVVHPALWNAYRCT